ncbi:MAG TPA: DUF5677 domain-containing protein [Pirellulales bacterium]|jgi:hypothetical protein
MPNEELNRATLAKHYKPLFDATRGLFDVGMNIHTALCNCKSASLPVNVHEFLLGTLTRDLRRLRSSILECEIGHSETAFLLSRILLEGLLSVKFVMGETIPQSQQSENLRKSVTGLPKIPQNIDPRSFRAEVYRAAAAMAYWRVSDKTRNHPVLGEASRRFHPAFANIERNFGAKWAKHLKDNTHFSGMSIRKCFELHGILDWYDTIYGPQSSPIHANDAYSFVKYNEAESSYDVLIVGEPTNFVTSLCMPTAVMGTTLEVIDRVAELGFAKQLNEAAQKIEPFTKVNRSESV